MKVVGVIGAGAAGLTALRHILAIPGLEPICWEYQSDVGGQWIFSPSAENDEFGNPIHSSMYSSLTTNLPKEIMKFPDFAFPHIKASYVHHTEVLQYLKNYATHFDLQKHINFKHCVEVVEPIFEDGEPEPKWKLFVKNMMTGSSSTTICNYIFICNGHASVPDIADIRNIESFTGKKIHSHYYRNPNPFKGLSVAVLGASASGLDISLEVAAVAKKVFLCHNLVSPNPSKLPNNVSFRKGIKEAKENGFLLLDNSFIEVDALIYCTGYKYKFSFLNPSCSITPEDGYVTFLYKHLINSSFPSMFLIGMNSHILPFPMFDIQVRYCLKVLTGELHLPDKSAMRKEVEELMRGMLSRGKPLRYLHDFAGGKQWGYANSLAEEANLVPFEKYVELVYEDSHNRRNDNLMTYQKNNYSITGTDSFIVDCYE